MTAYTVAAPFEFEGVKVFESPDNPRKFVRLTLQGTDDPGVAVTDAEIRALIAYHEAERDTWAYTNADRTEARRGRFTVKIIPFLNRFQYALDHDEAGRCGYSYRGEPMGTASSAESGALFADFLAWQSTQTPTAPEEPSGFGYVGTLVDSHGFTWDVFRTGSIGVYWLVEQRGGSYMFGPNASGLRWAEVLDLGTFVVVER